MNHPTYTATREAYRVALRLDRKAARAHAENMAYGLHKGTRFDPDYHARQVLHGLSEREVAAVTARPVRLGRVPLGPRAMRIWMRGGTDLNKRAALRRALAQIDAAFPRGVAA